MPQSDEPNAEPEQLPAVCRWCKGEGRQTVNFKTKRCEECNGTGRAPALPADDPPLPTLPMDERALAELRGRRPADWLLLPPYHFSRRRVGG